MCERCRPRRSWRRPVPPGWALLYVLVLGVLCWGAIGAVVWLLWPWSAWVGIGLLAGIFVCNLTVFW